jgi:hypothetical protein
VVDVTEPKAIENGPSAAPCLAGREGWGGHDLYLRHDDAQAALVVDVTEPKAVEN